MLIGLFLLSWFVISWVSIIHGHLLEGQREDGFFFQGIFRDLWNNDDITEFGKIVISIVLIILISLVLVGSLLILKPLFVKMAKEK